MVSVRDARIEDAEALHALYHASYADREGPERPLKDTLDDVRGYIREGLVMVAENAEGKLVGSVMLRRIANVRRLAVAPEAKGAGLGAELLEAAVARATKEGFGIVSLDTNPSHPWLAAFYRRHGFVDRCVGVFPDGTDWLEMRRKVRQAETDSRALYDNDG